MARSPTGPVINLGIISQFRDEAPYLAEWIRYHRLAGVGRFWLYDDGSTDDWRSAISADLRDGVVEVIPVSSVNKADPRTPASIRQLVTFRDGLSRAQGKARWVALIDADEFLLPMLDETVPACLGRRFRHDASAVYVNWRMFGASGAIVPIGEPLLDKLTACSAVTHPDNLNGKSLVKPDRVDVDGAWTIHHFPILGDDRYLDGRDRELRFRINPTNLRPDLVVPGEHREDLSIRINHYSLRDEGFYARNRVRRAGNRTLPGKSLERLTEHHRSFGVDRDIKILEFLSRHHPQAFEEHWNNGLPGLVGPR